MKKVALFLCLILAFSACNATPDTEPVLAVETQAAKQPSAQTENNPEFPSGSLYAIELTPGEQNLVKVDMATAVKTPIFSVPVNGWLSSFDYQPETQQFILAYAPPPPAGEVQFGFSSLYLWHIGAEMPTLLIEPNSASDVFFNPIWSADGGSIIYSYVTPLDEEAYTFKTTLNQFDLATQAVTVLAENSVWPALSTDGEKLAFVSLKPETNANALFVADADGANALTLLPYERFTAVDAPVFSPDKEWILFSAAVDAGVSRPWWEIVLGIQEVQAHNLPSDWYRLPAMGGEIERLTATSLIGLYGRFVPHDAPLFAFASQNGLYTMSPDGSAIELLVPGSYAAALSWSP